PVAVTGDLFGLGQTTPDLDHVTDDALAELADGIGVLDEDRVVELRGGQLGRSFRIGLLARVTKPSALACIMCSGGRRFSASHLSPLRPALLPFAIVLSADADQFLGGSGDGGTIGTGQDLACLALGHPIQTRPFWDAEEGIIILRELLPQLLA